MEPITLTTERLLLRPLGTGDADAIVRRLPGPGDPALDGRPLALHPRRTPTTSSTEVCAAGWRDDTLYNFGVFTRDDGALVSSMGLLRLQHLAHPQRQAELGYWTAKEQRGKGYTVEAARALCAWGFDGPRRRPAGVVSPRPATRARARWR